MYFFVIKRPAMSYKRVESCFLPVRSNHLKVEESHHKMKEENVTVEVTTEPWVKFGGQFWCFELAD